jgi:SAM-dependent methyltransferase
MDPELEKEYITPECNGWTTDFYFVKLSIVTALREALPNMHGTVLDVGCGQSPYKELLLSGPRVTGYLGMDLEGAPDTFRPDLAWDGATIPRPDCSFESALATEVLEHCPHPEYVLEEIFRVLKPGGFLFLTVPFLWPLHTVPYDEYRYTPFSLRRLLDEAGFGEIEIVAPGGWDASLATMLGLWVRRRPMNETARRVLQRLILPVYRKLLSLDKPPADFSRPCMITNLTASARKR